MPLGVTMVRWWGRVAKFMIRQPTAGDRWRTWTCVGATQVTEDVRPRDFSALKGAVIFYTSFVCVPSGVCAVNNLLYVVGGDDGSCNLASVEFYNPASDKWTLLPTCMSTGRSYAGTSGALKFHPFILTSSLCFTYSHVFFNLIVLNISTFCLYFY